MQCAACNFVNFPGMRFCGQCGARLPLPLTCASCGFANPNTGRFCGQCGTALLAAAVLGPPADGRGPGVSLPPTGYANGHSTGPLPPLAETNGLSTLVPARDERKIVTILF